MPDDKLRILFIDDEELVRRTASTDLPGRLKEKGINAEVVPAESVRQAIEALERDGFHLAIVDLRFEREALDGNEILASILESRVLPIIVYTGYGETDLNEVYEGHGLIFVAPKKRMEHLVEKIVEWHENKVFQFFSEEGLVAKSLQKTLQNTMWKNVSRYWDHLPTDDPENLTAIAGRIAATLLHDELTSKGAAKGEGETPVHHGEVYILHTPRQYLSVGDLLEFGDNLRIVLTPACDLIPRSGSSPKAKVVLLAECKLLSSFIKETPDLQVAVEKLQEDVDAPAAQKAAGRIEKMMRHSWLNDDGRRFFLPPFAQFGGGVVDFLALTSESHSNENLEELVGRRLISLNQEMAAELASRFARFVVRLGQLPFQTRPLIEAVLRVYESS